MTATNLRRVMIANDSRDGLEAALAKAALIEHYSGAELLAVQTLYDAIADEPAEVLPPAEQARLTEALKAREEDALAAAVAPLRERVASLEYRLIWARDTAGAIVQAAADWQAQLLIKPVSKHHPVADYLHTPLDWALMRQAPCPVLISTGSAWNEHGDVLAAVDAADEAHDALNHEILRRAATIVDVMASRLHVVTCYPDLGQAVNELQVAGDFEGLKADMRESRRRKLSAMLHDLELEGAEMHLLEGKPGRLIPTLAARLGVPLTVLGTAARKGVAKLVIGNTAEDLIGRLQGDLMTVRAPWS